MASDADADADAEMAAVADCVKAAEGYLERIRKRYSDAEAAHAAKIESLDSRYGWARTKLEDFVRASALRVHDEDEDEEAACAQRPKNIDDLIKQRLQLETERFGAAATRPTEEEVACAQRHKYIDDLMTRRQLELDTERFGAAATRPTESTQRTVTSSSHPWGAGWVGPRL
jgi:hypothetical protein